MGLLWTRAKPAPDADDPTRNLGIGMGTPYVAAADDGSYDSVFAGAGDTSLQSIAVHAAVDLLASLASELPIHVYTGTGPNRRERPVPEHLQDPDGSGHGLADWAYRVVQSWALRGNTYGEILDVSPTGKPRQVELFHPDQVNGWLSDGKVKWIVNGHDFTNHRFMHARVNPVAGRVLGLSPVALHAVSIGLSLTSTRYGYQWFRDDAHPGSLLTNTEKNLTDRQVKKTKEWFMAAFRGNREPAVLGRGWGYEKIQVAPEESQFLQTQGFTEAQCARIFGPGIAETLGYESGGSLTYANVESRASHLLVFTVNKWFRRLERLLDRMLPDSQYTRIDRDALLQSTTLERYRAHESALRSRWKVVNEVRESEDLPPVDWGNEPEGMNDGDEPDADNPQPTGAEAPQPRPAITGGN